MASPFSFLASTLFLTRYSTKKHALFTALGLGTIGIGSLPPL